MSKMMIVATLMMMMIDMLTSVYTGCLLLPSALFILESSIFMAGPEQESEIFMFELTYSGLSNFKC